MHLLMYKLENCLLYDEKGRVYLSVKNLYMVKNSYGVLKLKNFLIMQMLKRK